MNLTFISLSEAKNVYFMSGEATNEINVFLESLDEINGIFMTKKFNFLFYIFKGIRFFPTIWRHT